MHRFIVLALLFLSGFASLVYQILWMRELGLLFGSTSQAAAGTLAVFFGGLAIGGAIWSQRAPRSPCPLVEYGLVEIGIGLSGVLYFGLMPLYAELYSPIHAILSDHQALLLALKLFLAAIVLLPPAVLMGATLPLMAQYMVGAGASLGRVGTLLYGVNTLGAALGALATGFWLPVWLGFNASYLLAVFLSMLVGAIAWILGKRPVVDGMHAPMQVKGNLSRDSEETTETVSLINPKLIVTTFASGFLALALEVLWTRMFQQVLQNSVYTFSIILVTFLAALSVGAFLARKMAGFSINPWTVLSIVLTVAAFGTLLTPFLFYELTDGMRYLGAGEQWSVYLVSIFSGAALVLFLPGVAVGTVYPFLLRVAERSGEAGQVVGRLSAINTIGAIAGSLLAGFVMVSTVGLWTSLLLVALTYLLLGAWVVRKTNSQVLWVQAAGIVLAVTLANPSHLPGVRLNQKSERLLASWEGSDGFVSVIERNGSRRIKINNFYALGSTAAMEAEQNQTLVPMLVHPSPEKIFYLGMGTGITAGAAMRLPTREVTVTELVPEVITAAREYFHGYAQGLFSDPRVRILARDGRNELLGSGESYDAIISDLFIPWRAGVGNLYSLNHYENARDRLRSGGVYVQWIPLYQVTETEFWAIARTFLEVFPQVQVWRGDFYVEHSILALVGSVDAKPVSSAAIIRNGRYLSGSSNLDPTTYLAVSLPFYAGNLGESREIVPPGPIHTDDRPVIDYQAPISHRNARAGRVEWITGARLMEFYEQLHRATPVNKDPYLSQLDSATRGFVNAGFSYHTAALLNHLGESEKAERHLREFFAQVPVRIEFNTSGNGASVIEE